MERYWQVLPGLKAALFASVDRPGYCRLQVPVGEINPVIFNHAEFTAFHDGMSAAILNLDSPYPELTATGSSASSMKAIS